MLKYERSQDIDDEREAASLWREAGYREAASGERLRGIGSFVILSRAAAVLNVWEALREAEAAAGKNDIPLLMARRGSEEWVVVLRWSDFRTILCQHERASTQTR